MCVQNQVDELQIKLEAAEGERKKAEVEAKEHREKMSELENGHQKTHLEQTNQLEELKMKVYMHINVCKLVLIYINLNINFTTCHVFTCLVQYN